MPLAGRSFATVSWGYLAGSSPRQSGDGEDASVALAQWRMKASHTEPGRPHIPSFQVAEAGREMTGHLSSGRRHLPPDQGALAQLGERLNRIQ